MRIKMQLYILFVLIPILSCNYKTKLPSGEINNNVFLKEIEEFNVQEAINRADIWRTAYVDTSILNLYQGNGRFGCSYGSMGLHIRPEDSDKMNKYGKTQYMHIKHYIRAKFGSDYLLPLMRVYWDKEPKQVTNYTQHQSFYDGTITTHFEYNQNKVTVTTWFDPVERDLAGLKINVEGNAPRIVIKSFDTLKINYNQEVVQTSNIKYDSGSYKINLTCLNVNTPVFINTDANTRIEDNRLYLNLHEGENTILISVKQQDKTNSKQSLPRTISWWHSKWNNSACLSLPDDYAQKMWVRSMAYILATNNDDKLGLTPPTGFTGNCWPFPFPHDLSFILPVFLSTGNIDIAKSWVEYWAERLSGMKNYTKRLFDIEGILFPWVFPYGSFEGYHDPSPPNKYYYEIHNSGYLARMAHETAVLVNDADWTEKYAIPLIRETALAYRNFCFKEPDGYWHLFITPSLGQDENGGINQKDYLDVLFSAKYCFQKAIDYNLDTDGFYKTVLENGLAFPSLKSKQGYYYTNQGSGEENFGKQKHPVQLNELAFLPVNKKITNPAATAYKFRYEITENAQNLRFYGWTLCNFLLAGSRMGDTTEWMKDWNNLRISDSVDPDWIQLYESSGAKDLSYFFTNNGLIAQSLLNNLVMDWFGKLEVAKCNLWEGKILFKNIHSLLGIKISGKIENNMAILYLEAWKDCAFEIQGEKITMKKNEKIKLKINTR